MLYRGEKYWEISIDLPQKAKTSPKAGFFK